jgi:hypothetical protein
LGQEKKSPLLTLLQVAPALVSDVEDFLSEELMGSLVQKKRSRVDMEDGTQNIFAKLDQSQINTLILTCFDLAYEEARELGRQRFSVEMQEKLRNQVEKRTGLTFHSFKSLQKRYERIVGSGTVERKSGSGRKTKFTDEIVERTKKILRDSNYEISFPEAHETLLEEFRKENREKEVPGRSQFLKFLRESGQFKRRRKKYHPTLTDKHKVDRVAYAEHQVNTEFAEEERTVFSDEKWFQANAPVTLRMPQEDGTPPGFMQSKTNPVKVMVQVALMAPREGFSGVVGTHTFTVTEPAKRNSKNRQKGTMVEKGINVSGKTYLEAWRQSILPALKDLIDAKKIPRPSARFPLLLQDDNAKAHRAKDANPQLICRIARDEFGIEMIPKDPSQPAQSPDLNPLDTFFFRILFVRFRRLRAQARVKASAQGLRERAEEFEENEEDGEEDVNFEENFEEGRGDDGAGEFKIAKRKRIPLRCKRHVGHGNPKCPSCSKVVKPADEFCECSFRGGRWHMVCAQIEWKQDRTLQLDQPGRDSWVCSQCAHHLCQNHNTAVCVKCGKPSARSGDEMGTDMVACDSIYGGLFHKSCVDYVEADEEEMNDFWYCQVCNTFLPDEQEAYCHELPEDMSSASVPALRAAVEASIQQIAESKIKRGFETRKAIVKKVLDDNGGNTFTLHWRREKQDEEKQ